MALLKLKGDSVRKFLVNIPSEILLNTFRMTLYAKLFVKPLVTMEDIIYYLHFQILLLQNSDDILKKFKTSADVDSR